MKAVGPKGDLGWGNMKMWILPPFPVFQMFRKLCLFADMKLRCIAELLCNSNKRRQKLQEEPMSVWVNTQYSHKTPQNFCFWHLTALLFLAFHMATFQYWWILICQILYVRAYRLGSIQAVGYNMLSLILK